MAGIWDIWKDLTLGHLYKEKFLDAEKKIAALTVENSALQTKVAKLLVETSALKLQIEDLKICLDQTKAKPATVLPVAFRRHNPNRYINDGI